MRSLLGLAALLAVVGCSSEEAASGPVKTPAAPDTARDAPATTTGTTSAALETTACRYLVPKSAEGTKVVCYDLSVKESRRPGASDKTIKLHVARIKGAAKTGVPTIELIGGPGGGGDSLVGGIVAGVKDLTDAYAPLLAKGDLIVFDQRGVGRSLPRLGCPMPSDPKAEPSTKDCRDALQAKGIDLAAYDTVENADDVHDLKVALGVDKIDLHGISYGTRLALEIVKRHAGDVHATIIDGVMPPDVPILGAFEAAADKIFSRVFTACAADAACNAAYPDLEGTLVAAQKRLDATPVQVTHPLYGPMTYDWPTFRGELLEGLYVEGAAAAIPARLRDALTLDGAAWTKRLEDEEAAYAAKAAAMQGDADPVKAELRARIESMTEEDFEASGMAGGMYLSVTCNDYVQHESVDAARAVLSGVRPVLADVSAAEQEADACSSWPTRPSDARTREPARFAGKALVIGGLLDPATPSTWAEHVAETLGDRTLVLVPDGAHGFMDECGSGLKGAFFADPSAALDTSCATKRTLAFPKAGAPAPGSSQIAARSSSRVPTALVAQRPARTLLERLEHRSLAELAARSHGSAVTLARAELARARRTAR